MGNYEFRGGLEPGETQHLRLDPNRFGDWGNEALKTRNDLVLTVTVIDFEDAKGERAVGSDASQIEGKRKQLETAQQQLATLGGAGAYVTSFSTVEKLGKNSAKGDAGRPRRDHPNLGRGGRAESALGQKPAFELPSRARESGGLRRQRTGPIPTILG